MNRRTYWLVYCLFMLFGAILVGVSAWKQMHHSTVLVEWSTSSELNTAGFNVYRLDETGDQATKLNENIIPAAPDPLVGGDYVFKDENVLPGQTYYYRLEEIEIGGGSTQYGPIEVYAKEGGRLELSISIVFLALFVVGVVMYVKSEKEKQSDREQQNDAN